MAGPITIEDGDLIWKKPIDEPVYVFDWDARHLAPGVEITTSVFTIVALRPSGDTALTKDSESVLTGNRKTQLRLKVGTEGTKYRIDNKITTNESPAQIKERSFYLLVQQVR